MKKILTVFITLFMSVAIITSCNNPTNSSTVNLKNNSDKPTQSDLIGCWSDNSGSSVMKIKNGGVFETNSVGTWKLVDSYFSFSFPGGGEVRTWEIIKFSKETIIFSVRDQKLIYSRVACN